MASAIDDEFDKIQDAIDNQYLKDDFKNTDVYSFIMAMRKDNENS